MITKKYLTIKNFVVLISFVLMSGCAIVFRQNPLHALPLFISLFIMAFQADANRYGYLAGGLNSLVYFAVQWKLGTYASAVSSLVISFPLQIFTFICWHKKAYGSSTIFKKMTTMQRVVVFVGFASVFAIVYIVLTLAKSNYAVLDTASTLVGLLVSILTMLAYIEYAYLWVLNAFIGVGLNFQLMYNDMANTTFFVFAIYCAYCIILAFINVRKLYKKQQKEMNTNEN